ncbi:hypothetical protein HDIA_0829 [Hartmannibacter diazotrophicus]|uniref:Uncharacterized protein n=1 Tax=Hartmannibacter diazotrophicus TaxID=1482074 RepID=A0A2C9D297_9HYPH|nr:hypothetical protein HDIA_0829 [Hartmannibacter diazotrophicus]
MAFRSITALIVEDALSLAPSKRSRFMRAMQRAKPQAAVLASE